MYRHTRNRTPPHQSQCPGKLDTLDTVPWKMLYVYALKNVPQRKHTKITTSTIKKLVCLSTEEYMQVQRTLRLQFEHTKFTFFLIVVEKYKHILFYVIFTIQIHIPARMNDYLYKKFISTSSNRRKTIRDFNIEYYANTQRHMYHSPSLLLILLVLTNSGKHINISVHINILQPLL